MLELVVVTGAVGMASFKGLRERCVVLAIAPAALPALLETREARLPVDPKSQLGGGGNTDALPISDQYKYKVYYIYYD